MKPRFKNERFSVLKIRRVSVKVLCESQEPMAFKTSHLMQPSHACGHAFRLIHGNRGFDSLRENFFVF